MTPRQVREEIERLDQRLTQFKSWQKTLAAARRRWLLLDTEEARDVIRLIEAGPTSGEGLPADADLAPFDRGWPGLRDAEAAIAQMKERRELLVAELPSQADTAISVKEADRRAKDIRRRADDLDARIAATQASLATAAKLALAVAQDARKLWDDNAELDQLTTRADISRPPTPGCVAPKFSISTPLSVLLRGYFNGGEPGWLEDSFVRDLAGAIREQEGERATS